MDLSGYVGVRLGGNCDCRCVVLYASMLRGGLRDWLFFLFFGTSCSRLGVGLPPGFAMCSCA